MEETDRVESAQKRRNIMEENEQAAAPQEIPDEQLDEASGGIIAVLIGLKQPSTVQYSGPTTSPEVLGNLINLNGDG
jgi:hypothetical protein